MIVREFIDNLITELAKKDVPAPYVYELEDDEFSLEWDVKDYKLHARIYGDCTGWISAWNQERAFDTDDEQPDQWVTDLSSVYKIISGETP